MKWSFWNLRCVTHWIQSYLLFSRPVELTILSLEPADWVENIWRNVFAAKIIFFLFSGTFLTSCTIELRADPFYISLDFSLDKLFFLGSKWFRLFRPQPKVDFRHENAASSIVRTSSCVIFIFFLLIYVLRRLKKIHIGSMHAAKAHSQFLSSLRSSPSAKA